MSHIKSSKETLMHQRALALRRNMTKEERRIWFDFAREYSVKIKRQVVLGEYIADFVCEKAKLIIELDGSQHCEEAAKEYDAQRTQDLEKMGYTVLRISNLDVIQHFTAVTEFLNQEIQKRLQKDSSNR